MGQVAGLAALTSPHGSVDERNLPGHGGSCWQNLVLGILPENFLVS
jgi:hypothetical protein